MRFRWQLWPPGHDVCHDHAWHPALPALPSPLTNNRLPPAHPPTNPPAVRGRARERRRARGRALEALSAVAVVGLPPFGGEPQAIRAAVKCRLNGCSPANPNPNPNPNSSNPARRVLVQAAGCADGGASRPQTIGTYWGIAGGAGSSRAATSSRQYALRRNDGARLQSLGRVNSGNLICVE